MNDADEENGGVLNDVMDHVAAMRKATKVRREVIPPGADLGKFGQQLNFLVKLRYEAIGRFPGIQGDVSPDFGKIGKPQVGGLGRSLRSNAAISSMRSAVS